MDATDALKTTKNTSGAGMTAKSLDLDFWTHWSHYEGDQL